MLTLLATLPFVNAVPNDLVYDDQPLVVENKQVRSLDPRPVFLRPSLSGHQVEWYRPLTIYSLALNHALHGVVPWGYRLTNLALNAANTLLLHSIALRWLAPAGAFAAAALFAVHAMHVEAVVTTSGRGDLLAAFFALLAWRMALGEALRQRLGRSLGVAGALLLGTLSKESAVGAWPLILLARRRDGVGKRQRALQLTTFALALLAYFGLRRAATGGWIGVPGVEFRLLENPLVAADPVVRLATAGWVLAKYLGLFVAPVTLSADYSFNQIPAIAALSDARVLAAALLALAAAAALAGFVRDQAPWSISVLALLLFWLPVSNTLVPIGTIMAERLFYLPSAPLCLLLGTLVGWASARWPSRRQLGNLALAFVLVAHGGRSFVRSRDWRSEESLFRATVITAPRSAKAHFNYGTSLLDGGFLDRAAHEFGTALGILDHYPEAHNALGAVLLRRGDLSGAEDRFRTALRHDPELASAWANLGLTLFRLGRDEEARATLDRAVGFNPERVIVWATLGALADRGGDRSGAIAHYQRAYRLDPSFTGLSDELERLLMAEGRLEEARLLRDQRRPR